jgi:hypothetical protein
VDERFDGDEASLDCGKGFEFTIQLYPVSYNGPEEC